MSIKRNYYRSVFITLIIGVFIKLCFNIRLLVIFNSLGLPPYYGFIAATLLGYLSSFIVGLLILKKKYHVNFEEVLKNLIDIICGSLLMIFILIVIRFAIPISSNVRFYNLFIILIYGVVGAFVYFYYCYRTNLTKKIFGNHFFERIMRIVMKK